MQRTRGSKHLVGFVLVGSLLVGNRLVWAGPEYTLANALDFAGFDLIGQPNPLSGGIDFLATTDFEGAPFDFGAWDLTLDGPLSLQFSTGGRLINQFDLSFTTAVNGASAAQPLAYSYTYDTGNQTAQVTGTVLADVDFSMSKFGFYDLSIAYSSRQQTTTEGRFANDTSTDDFDLGPIRVSGNIYADALAILTDPIFDRAGTPNLFASFSGNEVLNSILTGSSASVDDLLAAASESIITTGAVYRAMPMSMGGIPGPPGGVPPGQGKKGGPVPEPAVLVLMLLGIPAILAQPRRRPRRA